MLKPYGGMSAIVLAGGPSAKLGFDKALLPYCGVTLVEDIVEVVSPFFDEIIVCADRADKLSGLNLGEARICEDVIKNKGSLGGIYSGLSASVYNRSMILTCDMPFMDGELIRHLQMTSHEKTHDVYGFQRKGAVTHPFPCVMAREMKSLIRLLLDGGEHSIDRLFDVSDVKLEAAPKRFKKILTKINQFDDYWQVLDALEESVA